MAKKSYRYIKLGNGSDKLIDPTRVKFIPQSRTVMQSDRGWRSFWNRPEGVIIRQGDDQSVSPALGARILQILFYGISFLLGITGMIKILGRNKEFENGAIL